jgi:thymidylate synthase ThyX
MTVEAKIIADSICDHLPRTTKRLTTFQLRYPRFIHAEFMTHRDFSRNASSSRAVPIERMIADILADTAMPIHWGKNQKGMQANEELSDDERDLAKSAWLRARDKAIIEAKKLIKIGAHKQIVNRILEPYSHISVVMTATKFDNFFYLRQHKDAQPEIKVLADKMWDALARSTPKLLEHGMWHMPYVTDEERGRVGDDGLLVYSNHKLIKMSVARSARVSYLTHDGENPSFAADAALYDRLVGSSPLHASPTEHQAQALHYDSYDPTFARRSYLGGNLGLGWMQFRKTLPNENYIKEAA